MSAILGKRGPFRGRKFAKIRNRGLIYPTLKSYWSVGERSFENAILAFYKKVLTGF